jgi:hypothetical protein
MKKGITLAAIAIAAALLTVGFASAAGTPHLSTFGTGDVFVNGDKFATFNDTGEYGGAYVNKTSNDPLSKVHVRFINDRAVGGGAPRFSIPIDENKDTITDAYAFIDVNNCGSSTVSSDDSNCQVFLNTGGSYANWAALVAANPTWRLAKKDPNGTRPNGKPLYSSTMPFIVADVEGDYLVHGIVLNY